MTMLRRVLGIRVVRPAGRRMRSAHATTAVVAQPFKGMTLRVGIVGDSAISPTVAAQRGEWEEKTGRRSRC